MGLVLKTVGLIGIGLIALGNAQANDPFNVRQWHTPQPQQMYLNDKLPAVPPPIIQSELDLKQPITLAQLTNYALLNSPATREAWAAARADAAAIGIAQADFFPQIDALLNVNHGRSVSNTGVLSQTQTRYGPSLSLSYVLFDFGSRSAAVERARFTALAASLTQNRVLQNTVLQVEQAYYQLLGLQELLRVNEETRIKNQTIVNAARDRLDAGVATVGEVYQAETLLAQALVDQKRTLGEIAKVKGQLAVAAGLPVTTQLVLAPVAFNERFAQTLQGEVKDLVAQATRIRADLIAAQANLRAAQAQVDVAAAENLPRLELTSGVGQTFFVEDRPRAENFSVGLNLRLPIFTGFRNTYSLRQARDRADQAAATRDKLFRQTELDVWQAYYDLETAANTITGATALLKSAAQSLEVANGRYLAGVGNILDLLTAQTAATNAEVQLIQYRLDWYAALSRLNFAIGSSQFIESL